MSVYREEQKRPVSASAVVRLVIWSVVLCVLAALFTVGMTAPSEGWFAGFNLGGFRYDDSGYSIGNGMSSEPITAISVEWVAGSVTVVPSEGDEISISEDYAGENRDLALRWKIEDGELSVKYRAPAWIVNQAVDKNLTLTIPAAMLEAMHEVELEGVDCDIHYEGNADELSLDVVDGDMTVQGDLGELDLDAVDGRLTFRGAVRKVDTDCVDGTVTMYLDMAAELNFDHVDGNVTLYLSDEIAGFSTKMDLVGGSISLEGFDGAVSDGNRSARWGDGSLRIRVDGVDCQLNIKKQTSN